MIIYYFNDFDSVGEEEIGLLQPLLPPQQQEALAATKLLSRKREIAISYIMLAYAIEHNRDEINSDNVAVRNIQLSTFNLTSHEGQKFLVPCNFQFSIFNFQFNEHGKPYLVGHEGIYFNISHCREAIAVGVSNREIGIDIEGQRRFSDNLLQRAFNEEEIRSVREAAEPEKEFARIWTRKEAYFKWTGTGILIDHIKSVEKDATAAGCKINTQLVTPERGNPYYLSIVQ